MIKEIEFQGKKAMAAFITRDLQPADEDDAEMVKIVGADGVIHWLTFDEPEDIEPEEPRRVAQDARPVDLKVNIRAVGPPGVDWSGFVAGWGLAQDKGPWDPAEHPRGQPENKGEFAKAGQGVTGGPTAEAPKQATPQPAARRRDAEIRHPIARALRTESYVSPSIGEALPIGEAVKGLEADRQRMLNRVSDQIDRALGLKGSKTADCVGAWADGAEPSLMITHDRADPAIERAAAAMKGHLAAQKAVLIFRPDEEAAESMATFSLKGEIPDIHKKLLDAGVPFHTLEPTPDGVRVHVYIDSQEGIASVAAAAKSLGGRVKFMRGKGEFIGTSIEGSDAEQRADAQRVYQSVIAEASAGVSRGLGRNIGDVWQDALNHWSAATERESAGRTAQIGKTPSPPPGTAPPPGPPMAPLKGSAKGSHPATIASRLVTGKDADPDAYLRADVEGMKQVPKVFEHNVSLLRDTWNYQNLRPGEVAAGEDDDHVARTFINHVKDNLKFLYNAAPKAIRENGHLWYEGAHEIAKAEAARYGLPIQSVAGVYASQSPQKLWDMNVYLGDRILDIYHTKQDHRWDAEMEDTAGLIWRKDDPKRNADLQKQIDEIRDKTLAECTTPWQKAQWIRTYDEAHSNLKFQAVAADGTRGETWRHPPGEGKEQGDIGIATWQATNAVANAVECIESGGDRKVISEAMGTLHKVRSFYDNILDPHSDNGDATVDTHAVGAGLLRALGASAIPVMHSLMTNPATAEKAKRIGFVASKGSAVSGSQGTYAFFGDAYREAAHELHIEPRTLQSVTWEAKRLLFGLRPKKALVDQVERAWQAYHEDKKSLAKTQQQVIDIAKRHNPNGGFF